MGTIIGVGSQRVMDVSAVHTGRALLNEPFVESHQPKELQLIPIAECPGEYSVTPRVPVESFTLMNH